MIFLVHLHFSQLLLASLEVVLKLAAACYLLSFKVIGLFHQHPRGLKPASPAGPLTRP